MNILLIEDDTIIRTTIAEILKMKNYTVSTAINGKDGVVQAFQVKPDLILCDIMMPELDGYEVLKIVRQNQTLAGVPFIFLTAMASPTDMRTGMNMGADDYLTKPIDAKDLLRAIESRIKRSQETEDEIQKRINRLAKDMNTVSAHEMNTPLNGIIGFTQVLRKQLASIGNNRVLEVVAYIEKSANRLKHTIDNLMLYQRVMAGSMQYDANKYCPVENDLVVSIVNDAKRRYQTHLTENATIDTDIQNAVLIIDGQLFIKIIEELLDNAIKFSPPEVGITITGTKNTNTYTLSIKDHGYGMTEEEVAEIAPFRQFNRSYFEQQGSGLGLYIVRELVKIHKGDFDLQTAVGGGTTITIDFPIANNTLR